MKITANGEERELPHSMSVAELVAWLKLVPEMTLVERNGEVVLKSEWNDVAVSEGDRLEFVRVAAGG